MPACRNLEAATASVRREGAVVINLVAAPRLKWDDLGRRRALRASPKRVAGSTATKYTIKLTMTINGNGVKPFWSHNVKIIFGELTARLDDCVVPIRRRRPSLSLIVFSVYMSRG